MVSTSVTRILSLALFLLSVAPLASLYALIGWFLWGGGSAYFHVATFSTHLDASDPNSRLASRLASVLQNPDSTLEELWSALFRERWMTTENAVILTGDLHVRVLQNHWTVVIPWLISLLLGVVIPFVLTVYSYVRSHRRRAGQGFNDEESTWISRLTRKERRLARLVLAVRNYKKKLDDQDFLEGPTAEDSFSLSLPSPGESLDCTSTCRTIPNTCAICLGQYATNDTVVWSSNKKCVHVFHEDCIISWLLRKRKQHCPCCRRLFLVTETD